MIRKFALASAALALSVAPIVAQAAPVSRTAAPVEQADELSGRGTGIYIIGAIVLALLVWGAIEVLGDDEPSSP